MTIFILIIVILALIAFMVLGISQNHIQMRIRKRLEIIAPDKEKDLFYGFGNRPVLSKFKKFINECDISDTDLTTLIHSYKKENKRISIIGPVLIVSVLILLVKTMI